MIFAREKKKKRIVKSDWENERTGGYGVEMASALQQCWYYCHFHEFESTKTEDHESEFENLTAKGNLKFGQRYFNMDKRFQKFRKKTFVQRFCKRCTVF